ncbi:MAG: DUF1330 domain-containing protein [Saprospiraceae bacterium]|nr:DUF1330 domain-containing protein [Saprospiraceae bacterium]
MATFCYFDVLKIHDEHAMKVYRELVLNTVDQYGGRYIMVGGPFQVMEGELNPSFPVLIEFPNQEMANNWYFSPEYEDLKQMRIKSTDTNAVFFQGL